jgi:hypothetical protein
MKTQQHSFTDYMKILTAHPVGIVGEDSDEPIEIVVTHGYSKDHRAECKQVVQNFW